MSIETLGDIAEEMADALGVYGACHCLDVEVECSHPRESDKCCRPAFVCNLITRMRAAMEIERRLEKGSP